MIEVEVEAEVFYVFYGSFGLYLYDSGGFIYDYLYSPIGYYVGILVIATYHDTPTGRHTISSHNSRQQNA
jgi:hypothetical protein